MPLLSEQPIFTIQSPLGGFQRLGQTPYGERRIIDMLEHPTQSPYGNPIPGLGELGDPDAFTHAKDAEAKLKARAQLQSKLDAAEAEWLAASEALEG